MQVKYKQPVSKFIIFFVSLLLFLSAGLNIYFIKKTIPFGKKSNQLESFKAVKVIDGDTFDTDGGDRIRLSEIDAPEYPEGCMGEDAKERLEGLILNSTISIDKIGTDNFGRTLAYVYRDQLFINEVLTEEGLAYFRKGKVITASSLMIEKAQDKAMLTARGVWSSLCQTKKQGCVIKGNYRSADNTRLYHTPDCYNYDKITIRPGTSDRWFCREEEASKAGFIKSLDCPK
ncbi:thermonuclease family protein [Candidatus Roizmanbacteria bacterium]|nr:thermonuclease family protein [Candidatus Roizmanbacteria bacterium]